MTEQNLQQFLHTHTLASIATLGPDYPESAVIEFGNHGLELIFDTNRDSRKFKNLQKSPKVSLVIGWEDERTVQYEGNATLLQEGPELDRLKQAYFKKSPEAQKWESTAGNVYFKVEPVWIRFTDLNTDPWSITVFDDLS